MIHKFDVYELDTAQFELRRHGIHQDIEPQVFLLLEFLIVNHQRMVSKEELFEHIWAGRVVTDASLSSRIYSARLAIGDNGVKQRFIRTVHGRGFQFLVKPEQTDIAACSQLKPIDDLSFAADTGHSRNAYGTRPSIAVVPLRLLSPNGNLTPFADAVSHEVILDLSRLHWLSVIARGSSFLFRDDNPDPSLVGKALGVNYLLTGTLECIDDRFRVCVELARTDDCSLVWADRFCADIEELLDLRQQISAKIVSAIEIQLPLSEAMRTATVPTQQLDAWAAFYRGLAHVYQFTARNNQIAAVMFERAIDVDPQFARAHAGLSYTHFQNVILRYQPNVDFQKNQAKNLAERAVELDPLDPFVNLAMARQFWLSGKLESALPWIDHSIELSPNYAAAKYAHGIISALIGENDVSTRDVVSALRLSPLDPLKYAMLGTRALSCIGKGDFVDAANWAQQAATAPRAHVHIAAIAAVSHKLAGNQNKARFWAKAINIADPEQYQEQFFNVFPFRDLAAVHTISHAMTDLGIGEAFAVR